MANMHNEFDKFHDKIALSSAKKKSLRTSRDAIRNRIRKYFKETLEVRVPKFHQQGSFPMGTTVVPLNEEFDVDDGVYLQHLDASDDSDWPEPSRVHRWLLEATDGQTNEKPIDKETCVRVKYAGQYHVDIPSYAILDGKFYLSKKKDGWSESDPKAITDWFRNEVRDKGEQLRRIVRCFKAWADYLAQEREEFVSSIVLTVLVTDNFVPNMRDDESMYRTARNIWNSIKLGVRVLNPVDSSEVMSDRLSDEQKSELKEAVKQLYLEGEKAVNEDSEEQASTIWIKLLGDRFPKAEDQARKDARRLAGAFVSSSSSRPWSPLNG